jgi:hypothetical protein
MLYLLIIYKKKIKKLAKSEFAYSLSRNMLKTISNLSMEVMSLN